MCRSPLMAIAFLPAFIGFSSFRRMGMRLYIVLFAVYLIPAPAFPPGKIPGACSCWRVLAAFFFCVCVYQSVPPRERSSG